MTKHGFRVTIWLQGGQAKVGKSRIISSSLHLPSQNSGQGTAHGKAHSPELLYPETDQTRAPPAAAGSVSLT